MMRITSLVSIAFSFFSNLPSASSLRQLSQNLTSIHFIGDLHADVGCAKQWVEKTNLVNITSTPFQWLGDPETDALVFLGDYVDKGSSSASVLNFVRELQESFPNNVVSILGNHDFFLILDTALSFHKENPHPLRFPFYDYAYSFMHPEEYIESEWSPDREDDEELLGAILSGLSYIYDRNLQGSMHMCAPHCGGDQVDLFQKVPPFKDDKVLRGKAVERLNTWRKEYAQGMFDSGLLKWLSSQPIAAIVGDALVVHGGVSSVVIDYLEGVAARNSMNVADTFNVNTNVIFNDFFQEELGKVNGGNQIEARLKGDNYPLELIMELVQHRGYFDRQKGCLEVNHVIRKLNSGLSRIVVGHTPHDYAMELCGGRLLASDSSLSRSFRAHGNMYCPLRDSLDIYRGSGTCHKVTKDVCEGSISKLTRPTPDHAWPTNTEIYKFHELAVNEASPPQEGDFKDEL